jgi:endonuclease V-like protein UPF0215 family
VKPGRRALGVAESYRGTDGTATSTLAGAVVRADRTVDDFSFGRCTVGGRDSTDAIAGLWDRLDRPDVRYLFLAGVAPAWYNVVDLRRLHRAIDRPVLSVSFEESDGLEGAIAEAFDGDGRRGRLETYGALPERRRLEVDGEPLFVRSVGLDAARADAVVAAYTGGRRPEPLRVAKRLARRVDAARREGTIAPEDRRD